MASSVALSEAQAHLPELLDRVELGEEIVIEREGRAATKLVTVPVEGQSPRRRIGGQNLLGITYIAPDFDDPMSDEELKEWVIERVCCPSWMLVPLSHPADLDCGYTCDRLVAAWVQWFDLQGCDSCADEI